MHSPHRKHFPQETYSLRSNSTRANRRRTKIKKQASQWEAKRPALDRKKPAVLYRSTSRRASRRMSVRAAIFSEMEQIAREQNVALAPLSDATALLDSGLDSLGFAILV